MNYEKEKNSNSKESSKKKLKSIQKSDFSCSVRTKRPAINPDLMYESNIRGVKLCDRYWSPNRVREIVIAKIVANICAFVVKTPVGFSNSLANKWG